MAAEFTVCVLYHCALLALLLISSSRYLLKQDRKHEAWNSTAAPASNLATAIRHSKAAQDAVTAFTTLATRAAHRRQVAATTGGRKGMKQ